jgi:hypothetical protein
MSQRVGNTERQRSLSGIFFGQREFGRGDETEGHRLDADRAVLACYRLHQQPTSLVEVIRPNRKRGQQSPCDRREPSVAEPATALARLGEVRTCGLVLAEPQLQQSDR